MIKTLHPLFSSYVEWAFLGLPRWQMEFREGSYLGTIKDCSRFGDQKAEKEGRNIRKEAKGKNSRDETLQDCDFAELDVDNANGGMLKVMLKLGGGILLNKLLQMGIQLILLVLMLVLLDLQMSIRPRTTSVIIHDVEEEPRRSTPAPTAQPSSKDKGKALMVEPEKPLKNLRKAQI
ncbi:hypothetical protein Tco_0054519 [Tanacetum coccineum]